MDEQDYDQDEGQVSLSPEDLKALRAKAKEADRLTKEFEAAQRKLAFVESGINIADPKMSYFVKGYEGELNADAIKAEAERAGFVGQQQQQQPSVPPQELAGHQQMAEASSGGAPGQPDLAEQIRNAGSQEEVMALMIKAGYPTAWNRSE